VAVSVGVSRHEPVPRRYRGPRHAGARGHAQLVDVAAAVVLVREPGRIGQLLGQVARVHRLGREATRLHGARHETARVEGLGQQAAIVRQVFPVPDKTNNRRVYSLVVSECAMRLAGMVS
jgi:hypothetical protein